jgi:L-ascorbate metabolism protein UlaG (beta-lactamase superfamily)
MTTTVTWLGHSALEIDSGDYHLLVDPYLSENPSAVKKPNQVQPDYIFVSHGHFDHIGDTEAISKRTDATVITNFEISNWLEAKGVKTHAQHIGGGYNYPFGYLKFTNALHGSGLPDGSEGGNPAGFLLTTQDGKKIYMSGDTGLFEGMKLIGEEGIDLAIIPIGDNYTMGPDDALRAVKMLQPKNVIPIHYNTWDLIAQDAQAWANRVEKETGAKVHVLKPGESFTLE